MTDNARRKEVKSNDQEVFKTNNAGGNRVRFNGIPTQPKRELG
jgi:hypothetical protein